MSYFAKFPNILYPFELNGKEQFIRVVDIALNVRLRKEILSNIAVYDTYDILDGETPELIAEKVYKDANLHWVIMLANDKYDLYNDFPMSQESLEKYIEEKYGQGNEYDQHMIFGELHFENENGDIVDGPASALVKPVSNYDYEFKRNEAKRRIKLISPRIVSAIVNELAPSFEEYQE